MTAGNVDGGNLVTANNFSTNGSGGNLTLTGGNIQGANVVIANSFTSNGGVVDFNTNNANVQLGNVANVHIYGGADGAVLSTDGNGNLIWSSSPGVTEIQNGYSNVTIPTANSNIYINANAGTDQQWIFDTIGLLTTPGNIDLGGSTINDVNNNGIQLYSTDYAQLNYDNSSWVYVQNDGVWLDSTSGTLNLDTSGNVIISNNLEVQGNIANAGNISVTNNITSDTANVTGNLTSGNANLGNLVTANYANLANDLVVQGNIANANNISVTNSIAAGSANITNDLVVQGNIANANNIAVTNNITSDTANVTGNLTAGNVDGGNLVTANNFSTNGTGGDVTLTGGNVTGANVVIANSFTSNGGIVDFNTNNANVQLGNIGNVYVYGGTSGQVLQTDGAGNLSWTSSANVNEIQNGYSNVYIPTANGNIEINANAGTSYQWIFDTSGLTSTPGNISLGGNTITDNSGGDGIQLYSTDYAQLNYDNSSWVYVQNDGVWLETTSGTLNLDTSGNVIISNDLEVQGNIANAGNIIVTGKVTTDTANVTGNLVSGNANLGNLLIANYANFANDVVVQGNIANANNITVTNNITSDTANVTGNLTSGNANLGNLVTANFANFANDVVVQGNIANAGNITVTYNINSDTANIIGNLVSGNAALGNLVTANYANITNDLVVQGDIANANNITVTHNITSDTANIIGNLDAANVNTPNVFAAGSLGLNALSGNIDLYVTSGNINAHSVQIKSVVNPTDPQDVATKNYVDTLASTGISYHEPVLAATIGTLDIATGGTVSYNNGTLGVGANLVTTGSFDLIDGSNVQTVGTRILVKNEANAAWNGVYTYANATTIVRSADTDQYGPNSTEELSLNDYFFVQSGDINEGVSYIVSSPVGVITFGTSNIVFTQFSTSQVYNAGTGLTLANTTFSISNTSVTSGSYGNGDRVATFTVNGQGQLTAASNVAITANAGNLSGTTLNSSVVTSSLTSVGTLTSLTVGNLTSNTVFGNGTIDATGNANIGNLTTNVAVITTGNITTINSGVLQNGTANITLTNNGNVTTTAAGNAILTITGTGANVTGYANISGNLSANNISVSNANVTTANVSGNVLLGNSTVTTKISWDSVTTTSIAANQTIASFSVTGVTGVEFLVKAIDENGVTNKYSVSTVTAVTDGVTADYSTFGTVTLGGYTGAFAVSVLAGIIYLQVTPSSSNSTVWTTQYRTI